ncbi:hypothetical protein MVEN_00192200 [Mycena venus]|uniref:CFEM domain-containing protein n=1 Tax=Mycena venus TaxID=2733690 RepID=A0A8H7DAU4_9AGAR|nr:hypothetical protein MVEN_00192200 [Mycena venus]
MVFWNTLLVLSTALLVASAASSQSSLSATPTESGVVLPSSTAGLDPCMETCFEEAAAANSCPIDSVNCVCASAQLQEDLTQCLDAECSPFASLQAQGLLSQLCNKVRIVATGSATPGHLSLSSALPTSTTGVPQVPVQNKENGAPISMVVQAYLSTIVTAAAVTNNFRCESSLESHFFFTQLRSGLVARCQLAPIWASRAKCSAQLCFDGTRVHFTAHGHPFSIASITLHFTELPFMDNEVADDQLVAVHDLANRRLGTAIIAARKECLPRARRRNRSSHLFPFFSAPSRAANDWSTPCFDGHCSYDIPSSSEVSGTLRIWGAADAISDITPAAGWTILDCEKGAMTQDVRLVCHDSTGCPHLAQNTGSVGKLVRLPESCGQSAFARVTKDWVHANQTLPVELAAQLRRRDGETPQVKGLSIDADFNSGGACKLCDTRADRVCAEEPRAPARRSRFAPARAARGVTDRSVISVLQQAFQEFNSFNQSLMQKLPEVNFKKTFPLFDEKISCPAAGKIPAFDASVSGSVDACIVANATLAVTAVGTLMPANFTKFGVVVGLDANLEGTLNLKSSASASVDSGKVELFEVGITGLDFPGILSVGPTFKVQGEVTANLDVELDLAVDLSYCISGAKFFYPPDPFNTNSGKFTPNNSPLNFSVAPALSSSASITAHIIPGFDFGVNAIGGLATAQLFIDFDTSSTLTASLDASASASGGASPSGVAVTNKTFSGLNGCVDIGAGLSIDAGADIPDATQLFKIFDITPNVTLFTKNFDFFKKCFGSQASNSTSRRELQPMSLSDFDNSVELYRPRRRDVAKVKRAANVTCPVGGPSKVVSVADAVISSASIKVKD